MKKVVLFIAMVLAFSFSGLQIEEARAVTLNVSGGILFGATGVDVLGTSFDVTFVDGSCVDLYSGCDEAADFDFTDAASAQAAAQALLDDVFIDSADGLFDTHPELTLGCGDTFACFTLIPYGGLLISQFDAAVFRNRVSDSNDAVFLGNQNAITDWALNNGINFAHFTPTPTDSIPEPSTFLLLGSGVMGLIAYRHRRRK